MKKTLLFLTLLATSAVTNAQWTKQYTGFTADSRGVQDIQIVDASTVWALGYDGSGAAANIQQYTRTTNGGAFWSAGNVNIGDTSLQLTNLSAVSSTVAWVGGVNPDNGGGGVWKTTNGGLSWTKQNATAYSTTGTLSSFFNVVHFFDANNGVTQGDPIGTGNGSFEVYTTTNGGTSWTAVAPANIPAPTSGEYGYNGGNVAAGTSFWFVTNKGKIYRTTNMGTSWTKLNTPITDFSGTNVGGSIYFSDNNNGILLARTGPVATASYTLYKTTDGGTTWGTGTPYTQPYRSVAYIKGTTTLVGNGTAGTTYSSAYSVDNGTTWTVIDSGSDPTLYQRTSIAFLNPTTGWAGGFVDGTAGTGGIYKYTGAALSIGDIAANNTKFKAYPNPANNELNISGLAINEVAIYDLLGKQVLNQKFAAQDQATLNVSSLQTGMYVLTATNENGAKETIKFAKQ